jgi:hypothetical protein
VEAAANGVEIAEAGVSRQPQNSGAQAPPSAVSVPAKKAFTIPVCKTPAKVPTPVGKPVALEASPAATPTSRYYTIMYTKFSTKKHKTYDDGVLTLNGTHAIIQNMEGVWQCVGDSKCARAFFVCSTFSTRFRREAGHEILHQV